MKKICALLVLCLGLLTYCTQPKKPHGATIVFAWAETELAQVEQLLNLLDTSIQKK